MTYINPNIQGWKTEEDLQWMYDTAQKMDSILEVGCWLGKGTHALLSGCGGKVTVCDPFEEFYYGRYKKLTRGRDMFAEFLINIKGFFNLKEIWKMPAQEALKKTDTFDLVFLDYPMTLEEVGGWLLKANKMIAGYNYDVYKDAAEGALLEVKTRGLIWYKELI